MKRLSPGLRVALYLSGFLVLAGAGVAYAIVQSGATPASFAAVFTLSGPTVALLFFFLFAIYGTDCVRYRVLAWSVGTPITWGRALHSSIANFFFSWITPTAAFGAPAATVMLARRGGIPWDAAALIAFGKSMTSTAVLLGVAFVFLLAGWGPQVDATWMAPLLWASGIVAFILALPVLGVLWPKQSVAALERLEHKVSGRPWLVALAVGLQRTIERLAVLKRRSRWAWAAILLVHLPYFAAFIGVAATLDHALSGRPLVHSIGVSTVFTAFTYVAPTPGASGLAEGTSAQFFGGALSGEQAIVVVLLFRSFTSYVQILIGLVHLLWVGGTSEVFTRVRRGAREEGDAADGGFPDGR